MKWHAHSFSVICPTVVFYGLAFAADKNLLAKSGTERFRENI